MRERDMKTGSRQIAGNQASSGVGFGPEGRDNASWVNERDRRTIRARPGVDRTSADARRNRTRRTTEAGLRMSVDPLFRGAVTARPAGYLR